MGGNNGIHHLAIATKDIERQIEFFSEVATSATPIDARAWIDPGVVELAGISAVDKSTYTEPPVAVDTLVKSS